MNGLQQQSKLLKKKFQQKNNKIMVDKEKFNKGIAKIKIAEKKLKIGI